MDKKPTLEEIQKKYSHDFDINDDKNTVTIKSKRPYVKNHPDINAPAYLYYTICKKSDYNLPNEEDWKESDLLEIRLSWPSPKLLEIRTRWVYLRNIEEKLIRGVCYSAGIWQIIQNSRPFAPGELSDKVEKMAEKWLEQTDKYIFTKIPELKEYLNIKID